MKFTAEQVENFDEWFKELTPRLKYYVFISFPGVLMAVEELEKEREGLLNFETEKGISPGLTYPNEIDDSEIAEVAKSFNISLENLGSIFRFRRPRQK